MFTRNRYDVQDYNRDLYQTIRPGYFKTNLPRNDCDGCLNPNPTHNASFGNSLHNKNLMDVDSELMGLTRKNTKCPENKYNPDRANEEFKNSDKKHFRDCPNFVGESTRLSNPGCTLRGTGFNRWEWLCQNPQDKAIEPHFNVLRQDTRLMTKDEHRACIPNLLEQGKICPKSEFNDPEVVMYNDREMTYGTLPMVDESFSSQNWVNCVNIS